MKIVPFVLTPLIIGFSGFLFSVESSNEESRFFDTDFGAETKTIFIDTSINDQFEIENPDVKITFWDGLSITTESMVLLEHGIFSYNIPLSVLENDVQWFECSIGDYSSERMNGGNVLRLKTYNYSCLAPFESGKRGSFASFGHYSAKTENPGSSYKTQRIWMMNDYPSVFEKTDDWGTPCILAVSYIYENYIITITMMPVVSNGARYYFADIPAEITSFRFLRMAGSPLHSYCIYNEAIVSSISYGTCYCYVDNTFNCVSTRKVYGADATLLSFVLSGYLTYGELYSNGCKLDTVRNLFYTWFENKSATIEDLKSTKILDYTGYAENNDSYEGLIKNAEFNLHDKWNIMCSRVGMDPKTGKNRASNSLFGNMETNHAFIIVSLVIIISSAIVFLFLKYRNIY